MIRKIIQEQGRYRAYKKRIKQLPEEHKNAMLAIEEYMWMFAKGSGMFNYLEEILEMFEEGVSKESSVKDIVGNDIAEFADTFLAEFPEETWVEQMMDKQRVKLRNSTK